MDKGKEAKAPEAKPTRLQSQPTKLDPGNEGRRATGVLKTIAEKARTTIVKKARGILAPIHRLTEGTHDYPAPPNLTIAKRDLRAEIDSLKTKAQKEREIADRLEQFSKTLESAPLEPKGEPLREEMFQDLIRIAREVNRQPEHRKRTVIQELLERIKTLLRKIKPFVEAAGLVNTLWELLNKLQLLLN